MNSKSKYQDVLIIIVSFGFLVIYYRAFFKDIFTDLLLLVIGLVTVIFVNVIKLGRIYIILYGKDLSGMNICFIYTKTAIVSSVIPYKIGELYRMYVVGKNLKSVQAGIIITLLDRLMDTLGLLIVMFLNLLLTGRKISLYPVVIGLIIFAFCIITFYFVFPGQSAFWKKYLLKNHSSKRKLRGLEIITRLQLLYKDITEIVKGRGILLIFTSVIAWLIEIGSISLTRKESMKPVGVAYVSEYLNSILRGKILIDNARYTILSVILLCITCIICLFLYNKQQGEKA